MQPQHCLWVVTFEGKGGEESFLVYAAWRGEAIRRAARISGYDVNQVVGAVGAHFPESQSRVAQ